LKNIHQIIGDVREVAEGFKKEFDLIVLDMKDDVEFIPKAKEILKFGGHLVVYNPYIEATRAVYEKMLEVGFRNVESFEIIRIDYEHKRVGTRPFTRVWHTGFLVIGRKI
jgi:tRNA (adenine57-N1/adenine58-N1)-methyltransferase